MSALRPGVALAALSLAALLLAACTSIAPFSPDERAELEREARATVAALDAQQP